MKKNLLLLYGCLLGAALTANAQINYSENFEGAATWSNQGFFIMQEAPCTGASALTASLQGGFNPNTSAGAISASIGTANASPVTLSYDYKVVSFMDPSQAVQNSSNWGSFTVSYATSPTGPFTTLETINTTNHVASANCATRTLSFTPPAGMQVYLRVFGQLENINNFIYIVIDNVSATQTTETLDYVNLQWPPTMTLNFGETGMVYAQAYEPGITEGPGAGTGVTAWVGVNYENTDPNTWTNWIPATFNVQAGNNDEFMANIAGVFPSGTYYYATRFQLGNGSYTYGGYSATGGGYWNGTTNVSGVLTVNCNTPAPGADATQTICAGSTVAALEAEGDLIFWYAAATGGEPLNMNAVLTDGTTYYASQMPDGGCESMTRTAVTVSLTVVDPPVQLLIEQVFCHGATISQVQVGAQGEVIWYSAATGGTILDDDTLVSNLTPYYAAQVVDGCESQERVAVSVFVNTTPAPTGDATQVFEHNDPMELPMFSVTDIEVEVAEGATVTWYSTEEDALTGENPLEFWQILLDGETYYATQTLNGCESEPFAVTVSIILGTQGFDQAQLVYYPNPVKDVLSLSSADAITNVAVYNITGRQVIVREQYSNEITLDMSALSSGSYFVKVSTADAVQTIRILKQ